MFWVISVYFNLRNILPKSGTFLPEPPVYVITSINEDGSKNSTNKSSCHTELALLRKLQDEKLAHKTYRAC